MHKPFDVEDREIEPILLARQALHLAQFKPTVDMIIVNPEIWKWYDTLFVNRPDLMSSVNTK